MPDLSTGTVVELVLFALFLLYYAWDIIKSASAQRENNDEEEAMRRQMAARLNRRSAAVPAVLEDRGSAAAAAASAALRREQELPYFAYAERPGTGRVSETLCAICVEPLRPGQHCSEVPACRHAFHRDCLGAWARTKPTCPLCRANIVVVVPAPRGSSNGIAAAEDMV